jgi:periplasmic protein CpxP/Spy
MQRSRLLFATTALLLVASPVDLALAQTAVGPPKAAAPARAPTNLVVERVDRRITDLHRQLRITAAQEPQWQQLAGVMHDNAVAMDRKFSERAQQFHTMNAVQNLQSYAAIAQQHAADVGRLVPAFQTLYAALTPQQQKIADQLWRNQLQHRGPAG